MANMEEKQFESEQEEPKIFSVHIDAKHQKRFDRRDFIKAAAFTSTAAILASCEFGTSKDPSAEETRVAASVQKTVDAMGGDENGVTEQGVEEAAEPTKAPTPTREPTNTTQPTSTPEPTESIPMGEVNTAHNMFEGPDTNHPTTGKTVVGEEVTVLGQTKDGAWYNIEDSEGTRGWVFSTYITLLSGFGEIPVITNYPTPPAAISACKGKVNKAHSLWEGPDTNHPVAGKTKLDEEVSILGKTSDETWYKMETTDGTIGWGYATFITLTTCDLSKVEVPRNIPTKPAAPCECDSYTSCDCDEYAPGCDCDAHSCSCNEVCTCDSIHYWYPN